MAQPTLDPCNDAVFKLLFGRNLRVLLALLNAVLRPRRRIVSVGVLNPEVPKESPGDRGLYLDLRCRLDDGSWVNVEMQAYLRPGFAQRLLYHWASVFRDGLHRGQGFEELNPCRVVVFMTKPFLPGERVHSTFRVREDHEGHVLCDEFEIHVVELSKLAAPADPDDPALTWARFLAARTDEERRQLSMENPDIRIVNNSSSCNLPGLCKSFKLHI